MIFYRRIGLNESFEFYICKAKKQKCKCDRRAWAPVESKSQMDPVWLIWDTFLKEAAKKENKVIEKIMKSLGQEQMKEKMLREEMGEFYDTYIMVQKMRSQQGMMARMPVDIIIK